ncbi:MAG: putative lipid II flippase FtsW [Oscillospiraceae bacterium]|nr:putative lipid II flippase FtsW [Oscillospiraceae bacterium]
MVDYMSQTTARPLEADVQPAEPRPRTRPKGREARLRELDRAGALRKSPMDLPFFLLVLLLLGIGVIMVLSASFASAYYNIGGITGGNPTFYFLNQAFFAISGIVLMLLISRIPTALISRFAYVAMVVALVTLALVPLIGVTGGGARRWISVFGITTFQPSELAKIAVVLCFAKMICQYKDKMRTFRYGIFNFVVILGLITFLLYLQPHLSAMVIILGIGVIMMYLGGVHWGWFATGFTVLGAGGFFITTRMGHALSRIAAWQNPFDDPLGHGWQIIQSQLAIGSGGLLGLGLGQSRQKYLYLPEEHNDYIFAIVAEELGFVGGMLILSLFAILIIRGYWIAMHAKTKFGGLIAAGMTSLLAIQVFLNVGVVTNLLPPTGISLPFFSYGGTALWMQLVCMGVVLGVSREIPVKRAG